MNIGAQSPKSSSASAVDAAARRDRAAVLCLVDIAPLIRENRLTDQRIAGELNRGIAHRETERFRQSEPKVRSRTLTTG
jgi:hypothetical protein